ncbi:MAG: amino acid permease [Nocardioides sp.]|uniref:APC family permease n=1 Tax=Nocardioides sp. TaxID=35761 RepID=UPI0039E33960
MGLVFMAPLAVFDTFGIVAEATEGHVPLAYLAILVAVVFTAFCYSRMVPVLPFAGSAYTYARRTIHPAAGFLVGWTATLDYLFLPMINALLSSIYMSVPFPNVPAWVWIGSTVIVTTAMNLVGVKVAAKRQPPAGRCPGGRLTGLPLLLGAQYHRRHQRRRLRPGAAPVG